MSETDQRLIAETEKWLQKAKDKRSLISLNDSNSKHEEMLQNIDNYISDCQHFLDKSMLIEAFEAAIWAWAWIEIMERLGIVGKEAENPPKTIHETSAIIIEDGDKVLMIKRGNNPEKGTWAIPGGHVDEGETYSEAAQREAQEEVGDIETEKEPIFGFNHKQGSEKRMPMIHWHYGKLFRGKVVGKISASSDASEMEWINKNEIKNLELAKWAQTVFEKLGYLD